MLINFFVSVVCWAPSIFSPIQRMYEVSHQSLILRRLRDPQIVPLLRFEQKRDIRKKEIIDPNELPMAYIWRMERSEMYHFSKHNRAKQCSTAHRLSHFLSCSLHRHEKDKSRNTMTDHHNKRTNVQWGIMLFCWYVANWQKKEISSKLQFLHCYRLATNSPARVMVCSVSIMLSSPTVFLT